VIRLLPLQEAFELLLLVPFAPHVACERIEKALHEKRLLLYRDGIRLEPSEIKTELRVVVELAGDGRWCCLIVEQGQLMQARYVGVRETEDGRRIVTIANPPEPVWEVDIEGAETLLPHLTPGRGRKSVQNWTAIVDLELRHLRYIGSPLLENFEQLCAHLKEHLRAKGSAPPKDLKRFRQRIRAFPGVQN
jgi:hypothetical protein